MKAHPERTGLLFVAAGLLVGISLAGCGGGGGGGGGAAGVPGSINRVSVGPGGVQGNGNSSGASLDDAGRYVAFSSTATNFVAGGDVNGSVEDVFVHDTMSGQTTLASGAAPGATGSAGDSYDPAISPDGNYVAFNSASSNLLLTNNDTNGLRDVFIRNWQAATPVTKRVSVDNVPGDLNQVVGGHSALFGNAVATDNVTGNVFVAFYSQAMFPLLGKTSTATSDVYARELDPDLAGLRTILVSSATDDSPADASSQNPSISASGQYVVFDSDATNLVAGDTNGVRDVFIRDLRDPNPATRMQRVSLDNTGAEAIQSSYFASVSATGRYVAFTSEASLVPTDLNGDPDVYLRDLVGNTTTLVSVGTNGNSGNLPSTGLYALAVSNDGRYVVFTSRASDLVAGDTNSTQFQDVFVRDMVNKVTRRVNATIGGAQANNESFDVAISGNGEFIAFSSAATNLNTGDTNGFIDVFYAAVP
jgi:Tol biopolymer transport system component